MMPMTSQVTVYQVFIYQIMVYQVTGTIYCFFWRERFSCFYHLFFLVIGVIFVNQKYFLYLLPKIIVSFYQFTVYCLIYNFYLPYYCLLDCGLPGYCLLFFFLVKTITIPPSSFFSSSFFPRTQKPCRQ